MVGRSELLHQDRYADWPRTRASRRTAASETEPAAILRAGACCRGPFTGTLRHLFGRADKKRIPPPPEQAHNRGDNRRAQRLHET